MKSVSQNPLIATYPLSSAASLNFGCFQNGELGNGLSRIKKVRMVGGLNLGHPEY